MSRRSSQISARKLSYSSAYSVGDIVSSGPYNRTAGQALNFSRFPCVVTESSSDDYEDCYVYDDELQEGDIVIDPNQATKISLRTDITALPPRTQNFDFCQEAFEPASNSSPGVAYGPGTEESNAVKYLNGRLRQLFSDLAEGRDKTGIIGGPSVYRQMHQQQPIAVNQAKNGPFVQELQKSQMQRQHRPERGKQDARHIKQSLDAFQLPQQMHSFPGPLLEPPPGEIGCSPELVTTRRVNQSAGKPARKQNVEASPLICVPEISCVRDSSDDD